MIAHIATVQILVDEDSSNGASDFIHDLLEGEEGVIDWGYLKVGGQYLYPTNTTVSIPYKEGSMFN